MNTPESRIKQYTELLEQHRKHYDEVVAEMNKTVITINRLEAALATLDEAKKDAAELAASVAEGEYIEPKE
jgi:hypothetical protein